MPIEAPFLFKTVHFSTLPFNNSVFAPRGTLTMGILRV